MNCNGKICAKTLWPQGGRDPQVENPLSSQKLLLSRPTAVPTTPRAGLGKDLKKDKYNSSVLKQNREAHENWHF